MQDIIKKAIEGGYDDLPPFFYSAFGEQIPKANIPKLTFYSYILDPLFWQALGKACGWNEEPVDKIYSNESMMRSFLVPEWLHISMRFHEINLTQGWDKAVEYLEDLIK